MSWQRRWPADLQCRRWRQCPRLLERPPRRFADTAHGHGAGVSGNRAPLRRSASALLEHSWWCYGPVEQAGALWPARQGEALTPRAAGRAWVTSAPLPQTCWPWPRVPGGRAWQRPQDTLWHLATAWWSSSLNQGWSGLLTPPTPKRVLGVGSRWGPGGAHGGCSGAGAAAGVGVAVGKVWPQGSAPLALIRGHLRLAG